MNDRALWHTKTFWFNVISAGLLIAALPEFSTLIPELWIKYVVFAQAAGNIVLRYITTDPVR